MPMLSPGPRLTALVFLLASAACGRAAAQAASATPPPPASPARSSSNVRAAQADSVRHSYGAADVEFMTHMIAHHAQAITMSQWAPSHDAGPAVRRLAERIINAQQDEIATMQRWLRDRNLPVPEANPAGMRMAMNGGEHLMLMPGMLTEEQMKQLDAARGPLFDERFLTFMIQHHRGALTMVQQLLNSPGAAREDVVFKLASDINVDQTTEVARMQQMLATLLETRSAQ